MIKHWEKTNAEFAKETKVFKDSCIKAGILPTARQASKWRNKKGKAYAVTH